MNYNNKGCQQLLNVWPFSGMPDMWIHLTAAYLTLTAATKNVLLFSFIHSSVGAAAYNLPPVYHRVAA